MRVRHILLGSTLIALTCAGQEDKTRLASLVLLDKTSIANLGIETAEVEESSFQTTIFALGRIEVLPGKRAVVSSRIPGRAHSVLAVPHQQVEEGDEVMWVESRQPGDPPPTVMLAAPMAGVVARVDVAVGQPVSPDQSLMEIVDLETVEAAAHVPQHLSGQLALGQTGRIRVMSLPNKTFEAKLAHLGAYADAEAGTIEAAFHVPNEDDLLRPGMLAEFDIIVSEREGVTSIPADAIQSGAGGSFVYVKDYELENAFQRVPVQLGERNRDMVEVKQGLLPGDEVVIRGAYALNFAGKGNVSLKAAMDAAHGHAHNEDGSEIKQAAQGREAGHQHGGDDAHHDEDHGGWTGLTTFFAACCGVLLGLLIVAGFLHRRPAS